MPHNKLMPTALLRSEKRTMAGKLHSAWDLTNSSLFIETTYKS